MPIHSGTDKDGSFYQWGSTGKKYHFNPNDKKSRQNALRKAKAQQTAIYSSGWKGDNNMTDKMKLIKVKTGDAKPSMRVKAAGNVFVEIYKDNKGFFYKIDVPGQTGYESKERFQDQNKALNSGTAHAKRFIATIRNKVGDAEKQLWETCMELQHKYRRKYEPIHIYVEADLQDNAATIEINWPSIGASNMATTKKFADKLLEAVKFADKIEAEIKKVHPNVKVIK